VVLIVAIAAAIPALASGHSTPSAAKRAIFCPLTSARGGLVVRHLKTVKRHGRHHKVAPPGTADCYPIPCPTPYAAGSTGGTGATGDYIACRPLPCLFGATGTTGPTGMPHPTPFCRPVHCVYVAPVGSTQVKRPAELILPCEPLPTPPCEGPTGASCPTSPCPLPASGTTGTGASGPDVLCRPIVCPQLRTTTHSSGARAAIVLCPTCPPPVSAGTARAATAVLHACPMVPLQQPAATRAAGSASNARASSRAT
jgi:hypothetical protein